MMFMVFAATMLATATVITATTRSFVMVSATASATLGSSVGNNYLIGACAGALWRNINKST